MSKNARLNGCLDELELAFVEREATPRLLIQLSIRLHLDVFSISNTVSIFDVFGIQGTRCTVHN